MGRRETTAIPFVARRAIVRRRTQEFEAIQLQIRALTQEARALRDEARAIHQAAHGFGDQLQRRGQLLAQALLCSTESIELLREACLRTRLTAATLDR